MHVNNTNVVVVFGGFGYTFYVWSVPVLQIGIEIRWSLQNTARITRRSPKLQNIHRTSEKLSSLYRHTHTIYCVLVISERVLFWCCDIGSLSLSLARTLPCHRWWRLVVVAICSLRAITLTLLFSIIYEHIIQSYWCIPYAFVEPFCVFWLGVYILCVFFLLLLSRFVVRSFSVLSPFGRDYLLLCSSAYICVLLYLYADSF